MVAASIRDPKLQSFVNAKCPFTLCNISFTFVAAKRGAGLQWQLWKSTLQQVTKAAACRFCTLHATLTANLPLQKVLVASLICRWFLSSSSMSLWPSQSIHCLLHSVLYKWYNQTLCPTILARALPRACFFQICTFYLELTACCSPWKQHDKLFQNSPFPLHLDPYAQPEWIEWSRLCMQVYAFVWVSEWVNEYVCVCECVCMCVCVCVCLCMCVCGWCVCKICFIGKIIMLWSPFLATC